MANLDQAIPFKLSGGGSLVWYFGNASTMTLTFQQGDLEWTETGREWTEARANGRHETVPVAIETTDNNVTGSFACLITSFKGSSNTYPYEAFTYTGNAAAMTTVGTGSKKMGKLVATFDSSSDGGGSQTQTFAYCVPGNVRVQKGGAEGLSQLSFDFIDLENRPTAA